jgi:hypothetical protein
LRPRVDSGTKAEVGTWRTLPRGYRILLACNLAFCVAGLVFTTVPSWRMFESIPDPRHELVDATGAAIRVAEYLPHDAYSFRPDTLIKVALFLCERDTVPPPLSLSVGNRRVRIERAAAGCVSREVDDAGR